MLPPAGPAESAHAQPESCARMPTATLAALAKTWEKRLERSGQEPSIITSPPNNTTQKGEHGKISLGG